MSIIVPSKEGRVAARRSAPRTACIYFVRFGDAIKVGTSVDLQRRLADINTYLPRDAVLMGTIEGSYAVEKSIHRRLHRHHLRGEWFRDDPEVVAVVERILAAGQYVADAPEIQRMKERAAAAAPRTEHRTPLRAIRRLAERLSALSRADLVQCAEFAGVPIRVAGRAAIGNAVNVSAFIKLSLAVGMDPATGMPTERRHIGDFDACQFALAINLKRRLSGHSMRAAAKVARVSLTSIFRAEEHEATCVDNVLAICVYIGTSPLTYCRNANVSRGTGATQRRGLVTAITETKNEGT